MLELAARLVKRLSTLVAQSTRLVGGLGVGVGTGLGLGLGSGLPCQRVRVRVRVGVRVTLSAAALLSEDASSRAALRVISSYLFSS